MDPSQRRGVALLGDLAQGTGHELSNLFGALLIRLQVLQHRARDGDGVTAGDLETLEALIRGGIRVVRPLQQLGAVATTRHDVDVQLDLAAEIRSRYTAQDHPGQPSDKIVLDLPADPVMVAVEPSLVDRVLDNLVANAREALPAEGGTISIRVGPTSGDPSRVDVTVIDDGTGMDEPTRQAAPTPYFTTKPDAPGLGLTVVDMTVMAYGGHLELDSSVGNGTTARFDLPRTDTQATA